jgi:hypothetical protein
LKEPKQIREGVEEDGYRTKVENDSLWGEASESVHAGDRGGKGRESREAGKET